MAMKLVLVAVIVMALGHEVTTQSCMERNDKSLHYKLISKTMCRKPHLSLVSLPVPDGFDFVQPSVAMLNQCTGLGCSVFPERCLPMNMTEKSYKVYAKSRNGLESQCFMVSVMEHNTCECRCDILACQTNRVFNAETCECECDLRLMMACMLRRDKEHEPVMWSPNTCTCVCDHELKCDPSMSIWDPSVCRCVNM